VLPDASGETDLIRIIRERGDSFRPVQEQSVCLDETPVTWLRLTIPWEGTTTTVGGSSWELDFDWPNFWDWANIEDLEFFVADPREASGWRSLKMLVNAQTTEAFDKTAPFTLALDGRPGSGLETVYARIKAADVRFSPTVRTNQARTRSFQRDFFLFCLYFGIMGTMAVFNLAMFVSIKETGCLWVAAYALSEMLFFFGSNGLGLTLFDLGDFTILARLTTWSLGLVAVTTGFLARSFLDTKNHAPVWDKLLLGYSCLGLLFFLVGLSEAYDAAWIKDLTILLTLGPYLVLGAAVSRHRGELGNIAFFLSALVAWAVGGLLAGLGYAGLVSPGALVHHSFQYSSAAAGVLMTLALAEWVSVIRRKREAAEAANRAKSAFLATMSHELRTPMNAVLGLTEYTLKTQLNPDQRDYLQTASDSARRLLGIINDILDFSKIESGKLQLECIAFDLRRTIAATHKSMALQAAAKNIEFDLEIASNVPTMITGDPERLRQVLLNLLGNALKFTQTGFVKLTVACPGQTSLPKEITLTFTVRDTGVGISPDKLETIFSPFEQADSSITRRFGGTGLGLSICKRLVELMGGTIRIESEQGRGSIFTVTARFEPCSPELEHSREETAAATDAPPHPLGILLVEDDPVNIKVAQLHLASLGHHCRVARNGAEALAMLSQDHFDLVLMDLEMPEMDGLSAARRIRDNQGPAGPGAILDPTIPIVAMTAHVLPEIKRRCIEAGMNDFVSKPINFKALNNTIARLFCKAPCPPGHEQPTAPNGRTGAAVDLDQAMNTLGVDRDGFAQILAISITELESRIPRLKAALAGNNGPKVRLEAHTVKGIAATIGAFSCHTLAEELETAATNGDLRQASLLHQALSEEFDRVKGLFDPAAEAPEAPRASR
jgi:signal transduction histidine kinase/DNA-binding response OmpR family regulator